MGISELEGPEPPGPGLVPAAEGRTAGSAAGGGNGSVTSARCGECGSHHDGSTCTIAAGGGGGAGGFAGGGSQSAALVVFARLPVPGRVKTRLAAGVGPQAACDFYAACAQHAFAQAASCAALRAHVYHSSDDSTEDVRAWVEAAGQALPVSRQLPAEAGGLDLGAKMWAAMEEVQRHGGGHGKVLITGTDIPDLSAPLLARAVAALDEHEMVIGPSVDGGYYLMGLRRVEPRLFQGMAWSTPSVLRDTLARADACGLHVAPLDTLPRLQDIDTLQDLRDWLASVAGEQQPRQQQQEQQQGDGVPGAAPALGITVAGEEGLPGGAAAGGRAGQAGMAALARQRREELLRVCVRVVGQRGQGQGRV